MRSLLDAIRETLAMVIVIPCVALWYVGLVLACVVLVVPMLVMTIVSPQHRRLLQSVRWRKKGEYSSIWVPPKPEPNSGSSVSFGDRRWPEVGRN